MASLLATLLLSVFAQLAPADDTAAPAGSGGVSAEAPANPFERYGADPQTPAAAAAASEITLPSETNAPTVAAPATSEPSALALPPSPAAASAATPSETSQTADDAAARAEFADTSVAPASSAATPAVTTPATPTESPATTESSVLAGGPKPAEFMRRLLTAPATGQLSGVAISLGDAMAGASNRQSQTQRAEAYWDLSAAVAQYYIALAEADELAALKQAVLQPAAAWDVAAADIAKRVEQTRQTATAKQLRLHRLLGATAGVSLPLPADAPHCGRYNTRYDEIFVTRMDPAARQLNEMLPLLHAELVADVRLFEEAKEWTSYVSEHRDPKTDGVGLLRAYELMALRRRDFIETAHQYNLQIAAYAELAAPEQVESERLVSMLIRVSNPSSPAVATETSSVTPATATQPVDGAAAHESASVTYSQGTPRTAWRPLKRLFGRQNEHSIVTSKRLLRLPFRNNNSGNE